MSDLFSVRTKKYVKDDYTLTVKIVEGNTYEIELIKGELGNQKVGDFIEVAYKTVPLELFEYYWVRTKGFMEL